MWIWTRIGFVARVRRAVVVPSGGAHLFVPRVALVGSADPLHQGTAAVALLERRKVRGAVRVLRNPLLCGKPLHRRAAHADALVRICRTVRLHLRLQRPEELLGEHTPLAIGRAFLHRAPDLSVVDLQLAELAHAVDLRGQQAPIVLRQSGYKLQLALE